jgi:NAD kinase/nicotinic acid mononucleotide adenylyltransferase
MLRRCSLALRVGVFPIQLDPPTLQHTQLFHSILKRRPDIEEIIIVPHTKFAVSIPHSLHIAALAGLCVRDEPKFNVDFGALERPDAKLPRVAQILERLGTEGELLHWYHDRHTICNYDNAEVFLGKTPVTLLRIQGVTDDEDVTGDAEVHDRLSDALHTSATVLDVEHRRGSETRRLLFEGEVDPTSLVCPAVLKYVNSHHLYRDFRKLNKFYRGAFLTHRATSRGHTYDFAPHVAIDGSIPRLQVFFDEHNKAARELAERLKDLTVGPNEEPDLIVPIGGDGFMMQTIRRHWSRFIPFFGVNAGHLGYLLNDAAHLEELVSTPLKLYHCAMLYVTAQPDTHVRPTTAGPPPETHVHEGPEIEELAFNDAWIERGTGQTALINVSINGERRLHRARGDGVLVSTAAGSTAYAIALGASPLPIGASMLQLVGSNIVSPARWKPVHLTQDVIVELEPQETWKRPCKAYVDGVDVGLVSKLTVRSSRVAGVQLAFSRSCDLQSKLYKLQFPRE